MQEKKWTRYLGKWVKRLRRVEEARFSAEKILKSRCEIDAFYQARKLSGDFVKPKFYVMAQVSLGEILYSKETLAYAAINWMRCDLVIIDTDGTPRVVIEVQGRGHYGTSFENGLEVRIKDQIKRSACLSAGIRFVEIYETQDSVRDQIKGCLSDFLEKQAA